MCCALRMPADEDRAASAQHLHYPLPAVDHCDRAHVPRGDPRGAVGGHCGQTPEVGLGFPGAWGPHLTMHHREEWTSAIQTVADGLKKQEEEMMDFRSGSPSDNSGTEEMEVSLTKPKHRVVRPRPGGLVLRGVCLGLSDHLPPADHERV